MFSFFNIVFGYFIKFFTAEDVAGTKRLDIKRKDGSYKRVQKGKIKYV